MNKSIAIIRKIKVVIYCNYQSDKGSDLLVSSEGQRK